MIMRAVFRWTPVPVFQLGLHQCGGVLCSLRCSRQVLKDI
jgi:hypothetical protein